MERSCFHYIRRIIELNAEHKGTDYEMALMYEGITRVDEFNAVLFRPVLSFTDLKKGGRLRPMDFLDASTPLDPADPAKIILDAPMDPEHVSVSKDEA